jgi:hypothetical protein
MKLVEDFLQSVLAIPQIKPFSEPFYLFEAYGELSAYYLYHSRRNIMPGSFQIAWHLFCL